MVTLYRNYTVVVQNTNSPYIPNNDLELLLYEGQLELKTNPAKAGANKTDVFNYGTSTTATPVYDSGGTASVALSADSVNRPGEYDFVAIDLNRSGTASALGEALYSVIARPALDSATNSFENARIIIENTDLSDSNAKQLIELATGGLSSIVDNVAFGGGTVTFIQYATGVTNSSSVQHLKITNLPSVITDLAETTSAVPPYVTSAPTNKLISRFNIYYSNTANSIYAVWHSVPAYQVADGSWVIKLQADQYNVYRSSAFGSSLAEIDLGGIYEQFIISVNVQDVNVHIRRFNNNTIPSVTIPTISDEYTPLHTRVNAGEYIVGVGNWTYAGASTTPSYNLDVRGGLGARVAVDNINRLNITSASSQFGYSLSGSKNYITFSSQYVEMYLKSQLIFSAKNTMGGEDDATVYVSYRGVVAGDYFPHLKIDTNEAAFYAKTGGAYIKALDNGNITIAVESVGVAIKIVDTSAGNEARFGYGVTTSKSYFRATSSIVEIKRGTKETLYSDGTTFRAGLNSSTFPKFEGTSTTVNMQGSANTYIQVTTSEGVFGNVLVDATSRRFLDVSGSASKFGHNVNQTTGNYFQASTYLADIYVNSLKKFSADATNTYIAHNTGSYPRFEATATDIYLKGSANTYMRVYEDTPNGKIEGYVEVSGSSNLFLSVAGDNSKFGYNIGTSGAYFLASSGYGGCSAIITVLNRGVFRAYSDYVLLGYDLNHYPRFEASSTYVRMRGGYNTYIDAITSSNSVKVTIDGSDRFIGITDYTRVLYSSSIYLEANSTEIKMQSATNRYLTVATDILMLNSGGSIILSTDPAKLTLGWESTAGLSSTGAEANYWKIPLKSTNDYATFKTAATSGTEGGGMLLVYDSISDKHYLIVRAGSSFKEVELT